MRVEIVRPKAVWMLREVPEGTVLCCSACGCLLAPCGRTEFSFEDDGVVVTEEADIFTPLAECTVCHAEMVNYRNLGG